MASQVDTQLLTQDTLIKLLENEPRKNTSQQIETDEFFLLTTSKFNAFLYRDKNTAAET